MEIARACYSISKLKAAADMVKAINWSSGKLFANTLTKTRMKGEM